MMAEKKKEKTTAETWLKLDLEMQSGAIWTDEKSGIKKSKKYTVPETKPMLLTPDPVKYGNKEITPNVGQIID